MIVAMPRDGAIIFSDLIGKLDMLRVATAKARTTGGLPPGGPTKFVRGSRLRLCSLLGVAIELPEFSLSFRVALRRVGSFVLVVLAHSMQSLFYGGCSRSTGLRVEQLRELK